MGYYSAIYVFDMPGLSYKKFFDIEKIFKQIRVYLPKAERDRFFKAFEFAEEAHRGQMRKDNVTPYIVHPVEVVQILIELNADEETLISALLHDVPEDTEREINDVKKLFGEKIAFLVDGITKLSKVQYKHNMPERQIESLKKLLLHSAEDLRVIIIKLADRLHNMSTLQNIKEDAKRIRIATETLEIYVPIANLLGIRFLKNNLEDLCFKFLFPTEYTTLSEKLKSLREQKENDTEMTINAIKKICKENHLEVDVSNKHENLYSIYKKLCSLGKSLDDVEERIGIIIVTNDIDKCYRILGVVHNNFVPKSDKFKDYIANPKYNGYQSLHTQVFGVKGLITEIQIRTNDMDLEAEYGIAVNFIKKDEINGKTDTLKRSTWVKEVLEIEKTSDDFITNLKSDIFQERIFVFTPKGIVIDLPKGATVIDFAFAIHSEIGKHAVKADLNGKIKPINTPLYNRDVVNVITSNNGHPELSWLSFAKTNLARKHITNYFKKISKGKKIKEGHKILQKEFDISGLGLCKNMNFKKLNIAIQENLNQSFNSFQDLLIAIGSGDLRARSVVKSIINKYEHSKKFIQKSSKNNKGIKIYIKIVSKNRFGLLRDISEILYKYALDMYSLKGWASKEDKDAFFTAKILLKDLDTVSKVFDELEQIDDVVAVYRVSLKGLWSIYAGASLIIFIWIFHPFVFSLLQSLELQSQYPSMPQLILYGTLILLVSMGLYLNKLIKKYFPFVRNKKMLWTIAFTIPVLAIITLAIEVIYFNLDLSFNIIFIEMILIYSYLFISYKNFKKQMLES